MKKYYLFLVITILSIIGQIPLVHDFMIWDLNRIREGEIWRLFTSSFTHTNLNHLLLNLSAMWLFLLAFLKKEFPVGFILYCSFTIGLILCFLADYQNVTFAGLSGLLHGLMIIIALELKRTEKWLIISIVIIKVLIEYFYGASTTTSELINARVAFESHIIGVISAISYFVMHKVQKTYENKKPD